MTDNSGEPSAGNESTTEDLAWPIPLAAIAPLAIGLVATMFSSFGFDRVLVSILPLMVMLAAITVIDLRELRVPNAILKPAYAVALPLLAIAATSNWPEVSLVRGLLGALVYGGIYFLMWFVYPPGMGFGDVKLAPLLGAQLGLFGWIPIVRCLIVSHVVSGVIAILITLLRVVMRGKGGWRVAFPFAPFMMIGVVAALVLEVRLS